MKPEPVKLFKEGLRAEIQIIHDHYAAAKEGWRASVAAALTDWRLFAIGPRPNIRYEEQLIRSAIGECLALRLRLAYEPLFRTLDRVDRDLAGIASLASNRDPWAPKPRRL